MEIRKARKAARMSQDELASKIGINRATLSKYENGLIDPSFSQLEKIADALDVSIFEILPAEHRAPLEAGFEIGYSERELEFRDEVEFACNELERRREDTQYFRMLLSYEKLNAEGQKKAIEYAEDLITTGKYKPTEPIKPVALQGKDGFTISVTELQKWQKRRTDSPEPIVEEGSKPAETQHPPQTPPEDTPDN